VTRRPARLVVEWPDGSRLEQPLPLPEDMTPCAWVARLGALVAENRRHAAWSVLPATTAR
jgi:hypothetical protein